MSLKTKQDRLERALQETLTVIDELMDEKLSPAGRKAVRKLTEQVIAIQWELKL